ncbi:MAG: hypothetical protein P4L51_27595 [Puia sp.]|nr:hypothetical protein [Puia sp.]
MSSLVFRCSLFSGIALIFFAVLHSVLGLNEVLAAIRVGDITKDAATMITISWIFSGLALFLAGSWILFLSRGLKRSAAGAWWQALFVSGVLSAFGAGCWHYFPSAIYLAGFMATGLILFIPLLIAAGHYHRGEPGAGK